LDIALINCAFADARGGGDGTRNQHGRKQQDLDIVRSGWGEDERGRAGLDAEVAASHGLGMRVLCGRLGVHGLGSCLCTCGEVVWEQMM
jgi:hypothetical protein